MKNGFIKGALQFTLSEKQPGQKAISYSQFSLYQNCPLHWKLRYIDKIKEDKPNISLLFGSAFHSVLQDYVHCIYEKSVEESDKMDLSGMLKQRMADEYNKMMEKH